ncbi:MAG: FAD:protein FMN transferase [Akkermansiaceae bacterium]
MPPTRTILIPLTITPDSLLGAGSGLSISTLHGETMGTYWKLTYQKPTHTSDQTVRTTIEKTFSNIIDQMSHWDPTSELSTFNNLPAEEPLKISPDFYLTLTTALQISTLTHGAYDPTIGHIVNQLGFGPNNHQDKQSSPHSKPSTWQDITLHPTTHSISHAGNCHLDLSSIAKGTAVDKAALALESLAINNYLLEVGGELRGSGCKPDGQPWWTTLDPTCNQKKDTQTLVALSGISIATSGPAIQTKNQHGKTIHHLIDPHTATSSQSDLTAVTVIAPTCLLADAWATALFILGKEKAHHLATSQNLTASLHYLDHQNTPQQLTTPLWHQMTTED